MRICLLCKHPNVREADARLLAGGTHLSVARMTGLDRQVVGRHVRNGHVQRGNPAAGLAWSRPGPDDGAQDGPRLAQNAPRGLRAPEVSTSQPAAPEGVWVWSADELAMHAWVDPRYDALLAEAGAPEDTEADALLGALEGLWRLTHEVAPGWWEPP
jgi:hypothetical protein